MPRFSVTDALELAQKAITEAGKATGIGKRHFLGLETGLLAVAHALLAIEERLQHIEEVLDPAEQPEWATHEDMR